MPFGRYTCGIQWHIVLDWGPWPPREGEMWESNPQPKHAIASRSQSASFMLALGEYKRTIPAFAKLLWSSLSLLLLPAAAAAAADDDDDDDDDAVTSYLCQSSAMYVDFKHVHLVVPAKSILFKSHWSGQTFELRLRAHNKHNI